MTSAISCPLWSSVYECPRMECAFTSPVRTECDVRDVLYAVLYVRVSCFVVRECGVSRRYIDVCYCDMFSVVNVYLDHLKLCVVCINSRMYLCCSECNIVSNECNEPTSCLVQPIGSHCCEVMYFGCFDFRDELGFLNCDDVCMCVGISNLSSSSLFLSLCLLTCSMMRFLSLLLLGMCVCVVLVVLW